MVIIYCIKHNNIIYFDISQLRNVGNIKSIYCYEARHFLLRNSLAK